MPLNDMQCAECGRVREDVRTDEPVTNGKRLRMSDPCDSCGCRLFLRVPGVPLVADRSAHWSDECRDNGGRIPPGWSKRKDPE